MRFRLRAPSGVSNINLPESATVHDLQNVISEKTGLVTFEVKGGFPPQPLDLTQFAPDLKLIDTGLKLNGEQLVVVSKDIEDTPRKSLGHGTPSAKPSRTIQSEAAITQSTVPAHQISKTSQEDITSRTPDTGTDPPEIAVPSRNGTLVLRVMPDDNSCLFRALSSAVLGSDLDSMYELRSMISAKIMAQPEIYSEAVLEKSPERYCRWITTEDAWGGAIELGILSQEFDLEICTINVQDLQIYRFNQGRPTRCILVYSGIHYDVAALSPSEPPHIKADLPAEFDIKVFNSDDDSVIEAAIQLCAELRKRHYYTDTRNFGIRCNTCGWIGQGESGATEHAKSTGHYDFGEAE